MMASSATVLSPMLLTGIQSIDLEHGELLGLLDKLVHDKPYSTPNSEYFSEITSKIGAIIHRHFENEEKIFTASPMPEDDKAAHIRAHDEILDQYAQLHLEQMSGKQLDRTHTIRMIQKWVLEHLTTHDLKIKAYVTKQ